VNDVPVRAKDCGGWRRRRAKKVGGEGPSPHAAWIETRAAARHKQGAMQPSACQPATLTTQSKRDPSSGEHRYAGWWAAPSRRVSDAR
jgi:hypothetical protein